MEITQEQVTAIVQLRFADNITQDITPEDARIVMLAVVGYVAQNETKLRADTAILNEAIGLARANASKDTEQDGRLTANEGAITTASGQLTALGDRLDAIEMDGTDGLTPDELEAIKTRADNNRATGSANAATLVTQGNRLGAAETRLDGHDASISEARTLAVGAKSTADMAVASIGQVASRSATNETNLANHKTQEFDPLENRVEQLETEDTTLKRVLDTQDQEIIAHTGQIAELRRIVPIDEQDLMTEAGRTEAVNPSIRYSGRQGDAPEFAQIEIPLTEQLTDLEAGRTIRVSELYLLPLFNDQGGAESEFYYRLEQGSETIAGRGDPITGNPTRQIVERDWVNVNVEDGETELIFDAKTGTNPIIKIAMIWTGDSGSFSPRITGGALHYIGRLRDPVARVARDELGGDIDALKANDATQTADIAGLRADVDVNSQGRADNADLAHGLRDRLDKPQFAVIENAGITTSTTITTDPTALNTELGGGTDAFARQIDGAVGEATQFLTRITDASHVLDYGAGRVLDVYNGRVRGFILRPRVPAKTREETRYITTEDGHGTLTNPAILRFGTDSPTPLPVDSEVFLTEGVPEAGASISTISMAYSVETNGNWQSIPNTIQFDPTGVESRNFQVPRVNGITLTADRRADGSIRVRATHNGGGNSQDLVTNGGAIRFDAAYVETITTPEVPRGQTTVDLGAFTGTNLVGFDAIQTGDNGEATAYYVTPTARYNTGYFILDVHRREFATDNSAFTFLASDADTPLTPAVMARLDGTNEYLGLFARNNHHADGLQLRTTLTAPTTDGTENLNLADEIQSLRQGIISGGFKGDAGESAYRIAVRLGYGDTEMAWVASLMGADGKDAYQTWLDLGNTGDEAAFIADITGTNGTNGQSAYALARAGGYTGSESEWIASLKGATGDSAFASAQAEGFIGTRQAWLESLIGADAYAIAVTNGFSGDRTAWLASLIGNNAYQVAVANGYTEDETAWLASLVGRQGLKGDTGRGFNPTGQWMVATIYNTDDLVTHNGETFRCLFDDISGGNYEPRIGSTWASGFELWAARGATAYEIAVAGGYTGSESEWIASLKGEAGDSAYQVAVADGFSGTRTQWLASLNGKDGTGGGGGGTTDTEKADISRLVETVFGDTIAGIWDQDSPFDGSLAEANALQMGDIVQSMRADGSIEYYELAVQAGNFTTATATYYPEGGGEADRLNVWVKVDYTEGLVELVADNTTPAEAKAQAEGAINEALDTGGAIELAIRNISPTGGGGGVSLEAVANEMRADGDVANIPIGTLPASVRAESDITQDREIIVPDNAMFRTPSTIRFVISSSIVNVGNNVPVSLRYTDDDSSASGERPALTDGMQPFTFPNIDLTRPIAVRIGTTAIQDVSFDSVEFINTKTGDGSLVDEIEQVGLNSLAEDTGETGVICTVRADSQGAVGQVQLLCSDETPVTGTATFGGEIRFSSSLFDWNGSFLFDAMSFTATRTSPDGDSNQVWRFDGLVWDFTDRDARFITVVPGAAVPFTFRGEIIGALSGDAYKIVRDTTRAIVLDQVAGDITLGGDPVMGGGVRYRTFYRDLTSAQLGAGSTQTFAIPSEAFDSEVTYLTWAALVLTASTTESNITFWGGDIGASANDRGAVALNLQNRGDGGEHSFGIARQTHGNAVRIGARTGTPSSETVVRVSITVRQGGALKLPT